MNHPIKSIYTDGVPVIKGSVRDYEELQFTAQDVNDVETRNLTGTLFVVCPVEVSGRVVARLFCHDPDDAGLTAHNGVTVLVDLAENRFKYHAPTSEEITAEVINEALEGGQLAEDTLPGVGSLATRIFMLDADENLQHATPQQLVAYLDDYFGNALWRESNPDAADYGQVFELARPLSSNKGGYTRAILMKDGTVAVTGSSATSLLSQDSNSGISPKFNRVPFVDGLQRRITRVWQGDSNAFCLTEDGVCWAAGRNDHGQLGLGNTTNRIAWTPIQFFIDNALEVERVVPIPSGSQSGGTYFLLTNGHLYFAGFNNSYHAGDNTATQRNTPVRCGTLTGVTDVYCNPGNAAWTTATVGALAGGVLYTWGYNALGQCGLGSTTTYIQVPTSTGITDISKFRTSYTSVLLKTNGTLWVTGEAAYGALGNGTTTPNLTSFTQISALGTAVLDFTTTEGTGTAIAAIIDVAGARHLRVWGYNGWGNLGLGDTANKTTPQTPSGSWQGSVELVRFAGTLANGLSIFVQVSATRIIAAGYNSGGNLGIGTNTTTNVFGEVLGIRGEIIEWTVYGVSSDYGLMLLTTVGCLGCGFNTSGQIGVGSVTQQYVSTLQDISLGGIAQIPENPTTVVLDVFRSGRPQAGTLLLKKLFKGVSVTFSADFEGCGLLAGTAADADAEFSIHKNGVEVGTITVVDGAVVGTFESAAHAAITYSDGDYLELFGPDPRDAPLADLAITLVSVLEDSLTLI